MPAQTSSARARAVAPNRPRSGWNGCAIACEATAVVESEVAPCVRTTLRSMVAAPRRDDRDPRQEEHLDDLDRRLPALLGSRRIVRCVAQLVSGLDIHPLSHCRSPLI